MLESIVLLFGPRTDFAQRSPGDSVPSLTPDVFSIGSSTPANQIHTPSMTPEFSLTATTMDAGVSGMSLGLLSHDCSPTFDTVVGHWQTPESKVDASLGQSDGDIGTCECLEVQAGLLPRLRSLQYRDSAALDPGTTLNEVSQAMDSWKQLERCQCFAPLRCATEDGGSEVLLLTAINLRLVLQTIGASIRNLQSRTQTSATSRHDDYRIFDKRLRPHSPGSLRSSVGAYEMNNEEDRLVSCLLLFRALGSLHSVVARLLQRIQDMELRMMNRESSNPDQNVYFLTPPRSVNGLDTSDSYADHINRDRQRTQMSHIAIDGLHQLGQTRGMLQKLEESIHPLKSQAKAYLSNNT